MRRGREILRLPVITVSRGNRVGVAKDLVIDLERRAVVALLLSEECQQSPARLIPFSAVRLGPDAAMIEAESCVVSGPEVPDLDSLAKSPVAVVGLKVLTEEGRLVGKVCDVMVDDVSGAIEQYEVSGGPLRDVLGGRCHVPATSTLGLGDEYMVVPGAVVAGRVSPRAAQPVAQEIPPWLVEESPALILDQLSADLIARDVDLVVGMRARKTLADEDAGGVIVFRGEVINEETVQKAKDAGKLNELVQSAGEAAEMALSRGLADRYAGVVVGRTAGSTVHTAEGEIVVSQGDAVTLHTVRLAWDAGVMDQLMSAIRATPLELAAVGAGLPQAAHALWDQVSERVGWLAGRR